LCPKLSQAFPIFVMPNIDLGPTTVGLPVYTVCLNSSVFARTRPTIKNYSASSVLVVVVLLLVGAGYVFLRNGESDFIQNWTKHVRFYSKLDQTRNSKN